MSLFWKFHCTICIPAYLILYMYLATGLRKGQHWEDLICRVFIFDNHPIRLGWNKFRICRELPRTVQWSLIYSDQKDYSRLWTVSLLLKDPQGKKLGQARRQEGRNCELCLFLTPAVLTAPPLPSVCLHFLPNRSVSKRQWLHPLEMRMSHWQSWLFTIKKTFINAYLCCDHQVRGKTIHYQENFY